MIVVDGGSPYSGGAAAMPSAEEMQALRTAVAVSALEDVVTLRIEGPGAFALLDRLSTAPLYLRDGEIRQTLLLDDEGHPIADASIASDHEGYLLFAEGIAEARLLELIEQHGRPARGDGAAGAATVKSLSASHQLWSLNGPYAWELASLVLGPSVIGMTYMTVFHPPAEDVICLRMGRTGEYGYDLLVPRDRGAEWYANLLGRGAALGCRQVERPALDQAALENWQFNIRSLRAFRTLPLLVTPASFDGQLEADAMAAPVVTPIELQLQWRVGYERPFVGAEALRRRRQQGPALRLTCFTAEEAVAAGDAILWGDQHIGQVLTSGWSHARGDHVGAAFITTKLAHPGIDAFSARTPGGTRVGIRTRTPPLLNNRSLYVDQHRHGYATRATDGFPPVVPT